MKEFFGSLKKTAMLGLISSILMMIYIIMQMSSRTQGFLVIILNAIQLLPMVIGFIVYFSIVTLRMSKENISLKIGNNILLICLVMTLVAVVIITIIYYEFSILSILNIIIRSITIIFIYNVTLKKSTKVSWIWFALSIVYLVVIDIINIINIWRANNYLLNLYPTSETITILILKTISCVSYIGIIPYFINYYNIVKEGKINGK